MTQYYLDPHALEDAANKCRQVGTDCHTYVYQTFIPGVNNYTAGWVGNDKDTATTVVNEWKSLADDMYTWLTTKIGPAQSNILDIYNHGERSVANTWNQ